MSRAFGGLEGRVEWATVILAVVVYAGWLLLTLFWNRLPPWVILPLGAWFGAWHMSLQHEVIHRHPTRSQPINDAFGFAPLSLWVPYLRYKAIHLRHHRNAWLTDPIEDPESAYLTPAAWDRMPPLSRRLHMAGMTAVGRLLVTPWYGVARFWLSEWQAARAGDKVVLRAWAAHLPAVAVVILWLVLVCRINLGAYALLFVWPAYALVLIRSFVEHAKAERWQDRTAVVEHGGPLSLLFLFNNLHILHHARPHLPWYRLPAAWKADREVFLAENKGPIYRDYAEVFRLYAWTLRTRDFTS